MVNYQALLQKYMHMVAGEEGTTFISDKPDWITDDEWKELVFANQSVLRNWGSGIVETTIPEVYDTENDVMLIGKEAEAYQAKVDRICASDPYLALRQDLCCLLGKYSCDLVDTKGLFKDVAIRALEKSLLELKTINIGLSPKDYWELILYLGGEITAVENGFKGKAPSQNGIEFFVNPCAQSIGLEVILDKYIKTPA